MPAGGALYARYRPPARPAPVATTQAPSPVLPVAILAPVEQSANSAKPSVDNGLAGKLSDAPRVKKRKREVSKKEQESSAQDENNPKHVSVLKKFEKATASKPTLETDVGLSGDAAREETPVLHGRFDIQQHSRAPADIELQISCPFLSQNLRPNLLKYPYSPYSHHGCRNQSPSQQTRQLSLKIWAWIRSISHR